MADHGTLSPTLQTDRPPLGSPNGPDSLARMARPDSARGGPSGSDDGPQKLASAGPLTSPSGRQTPVPVTRGSQPLQPPYLPTPLGSHFDWYSATFDGMGDGRIGPALALALGGSLEPAKGRMGYPQATALVLGGELLATIYERPEDAHVVSAGAWAREVAPVLRAIWPTHRVSRVDSALDFATSFDDLDRQAVAFAQRRGLKYSLWTDSDGGSTRYLGSRSSDVMVRIYRKTEQWAALHPDRAAEVPAGIVRAEIEFKPGKREVKEIAARTEADAVWGMSKWAADFARDYLRFEPTRTTVKFHRSTDWDRALHFLGKQYGGMVRDRAAHAGRDQVVAQLLAAFGLDEQ